MGTKEGPHFNGVGNILAKILIGFTSLCQNCAERNQNSHQKHIPLQMRVNNTLLLCQ